MRNKLLAFLATFVALTASFALADPNSVTEKQHRKPINLLENPGFETGLGGWTQSQAGTVTKSTSSPGNGGTMAVFNASSASQTLVSKAYSVPKGMENSFCVASIWYKTAESTNKYKLQAYNGSIVLSETTLEANTAWDKYNAYAAFNCPSSGTVQLRVISSGNAADLFIDEAFLGEQATVQVGGAVHLGTLRYAPASSCNWSVTNASYASFPADSDCATPVVTGQIQDPGSKIPAFTLPSMGPGRIEVKAVGNFIKGNNVAFTCSYALYDGTANADQESSAYNGAGSGETSFVYGAISYPSGFSSPKTFEIRAKGNGATACTIVANGSEAESLSFDVNYIPLESNVGLRADAIGSAWSGYHDSTCDNWSTSSTSYVDPTDASCALVQRYSSAFGTVTTSGGPDITFTPKVSGRYKVCAEFGIATVSANYGVASLTDGTTELASAVKYEFMSRMNLCGYTDVIAGSPKSLKVQLKTVGATTTSIGAAVFAGEPSMNWVVSEEAVNKNIPVVFKGMITSNSSNRHGMEAATILNLDTTPVVGTQTGSWITSVTDNGAGDYTLVLASTFSAAPICTCTAYTASDSYICKVDTTTAPSTTALRLNITTDAGAKVDIAAPGGLNVQCMGAN